MHSKTSHAEQRLLRLPFIVAVVALVLSTISFFESGFLRAQSWGGYTTWNADQEALSTTSEAIPATALTARARLCVFNRDSAINVFCGDSSGVTSAGDEGTQVDPGTGVCFSTTAAVYCVSASGTPTIDYQEFAP